MRIFFATDVHGSETCWRKFLQAGEFYKVDVIVLGGDMTGKALVPIVDLGGDNYRTSLQDQDHMFSGDEELARYEATIRERGYYPFRTTEEELTDLHTEPARLDALFSDAMLETVERWVALAEEKLAHSTTRCFVCPGNDDDFEIDRLLAQSERVELSEGRIIDLGGFQLLSTGWSNRTPWKTYREEDESELRERIDAMVAQVTVAPERIIFNFHCPPYGTSLDEAPALGEDLSIRSGGRVMAHVGSTAVRESIEEVQPVLSLHGHIHESRAVARLGRTLAVNPGSSYEQGVLLGAVVELAGEGKAKRYQLTVG